jgi:hypothetical protein
VWVSEDLKALQWRTPTGEKKPRGTLAMAALRAVQPGSFTGSGGDEQASQLAAKGGEASAAGLTLRFEERDVDLQVCISETGTHNRQVRDEWVQAFRLMLAIHKKREKAKSSSAIGGGGGGGGGGDGGMGDGRRRTSMMQHLQR